MTDKERKPSKGKGGSIYEAVTETLIELIEGGTLPWRTRWSNVRPARRRAKKPALLPSRRLLPPISISSGRPYRGVNVLVLWAASLKQGYGSPYWGSLRAWNQDDCRVKSGERATRIVRWIEKTEVDPQTGEEKEDSFPVIHPVFNVGQVEGPAETLAKYRADEPPVAMLPADVPQAGPKPILWEPAERLLIPLNPKLRWGGDEAYYRPRTDTIQMPDRDRFATQAGLYTVLMHEVGHWTGHEKRLGRDMSGERGTPEYWFEELVAELTACFVLAALDLPDRMEELPESAAYLQHYLSLLEEDRRRIVRAAGLAQKASDYILGGGLPDEAPERKGGRRVGGRRGK
jgi:antirestriction protein ArdC